MEAYQDKGGQLSIGLIAMQSKNYVLNHPPHMQHNNIHKPSQTFTLGAPYCGQGIALKITLT